MAHRALSVLVMSYFLGTTAKKSKAKLFIHKEKTEKPEEDVWTRKKLNSDWTVNGVNFMEANAECKVTVNECTEIKDLEEEIKVLEDKKVNKLSAKERNIKKNKKTRKMTPSKKKQEITDLETEFTILEEKINVSVKEKKDQLSKLLKKKKKTTWTGATAKCESETEGGALKFKITGFEEADKRQVNIVIYHSDSKGVFECVLKVTEATPEDRYEPAKTKVYRHKRCRWTNESVDGSEAAAFTIKSVKLQEGKHIGYQKLAEKKWIADDKFTLKFTECENKPRKAPKKKPLKHIPKKKRLAEEPSKTAKREEPKQSAKNTRTYD